MFNSTIVDDRPRREAAATETFLESPNDESFTELFLTLTPQLVSFFRSHGCGLDLSEDLSQEVNQYAATMHFLGQTTILTLTRDRGTGETYCMPHHLTIDGKNRRLMIAALRYTDTFVKMDGTWLFAERKLYVDWLEQCELS